MTEPRYTHLGDFSDWPGAAKRQANVTISKKRIFQSPSDVLKMVGFARDPKGQVDVSVDRQWRTADLAGEEVSWNVGYGPRTQAWVLRPLGFENRQLPGVLALHGHDGFKFFGKEKVADGPDGTPTSLEELRTTLYGGRAFAEELAKRGFVVLAHDVFGWGSRRFDTEAMPSTIREWAADTDVVRRSRGEPMSEIDVYNLAAAHYEHVIAKYCAVLGTTLSGVVAYEDRIAATYLQSRADVQVGRIGCVGLSGGGCRAALLQATSEAVGASVVTGMMSTYEDLLDGRIYPHTWMFLPPGLARMGDWPDLVAARAPSPLLVQYNRGDHLFSPLGMERAHLRIGEIYEMTGVAAAYRGEFYDGPHRFDVPMQEAAFGWLKERLNPQPDTAAERQPEPPNGRE